MQDAIQKFTEHYKPVLPVIKVNNAEDIVPLAQALERGGIKSLEITLRSEEALAAIEIAKNEFSDFCVSAGTITRSEQVEQLAKIGVDFIVTPGLTKSILDACKANEVNILPGINGSSDVMLGMEYGLKYFKLFPAVALGGVTLLKALAGPFSECKFCPTGGLTVDNCLDFYNLKNVFAFGGSWMVADKLIEAKDWAQVEALTQALIEKLPS